MRPYTLWVTWENQLRNRTLSQNFNAELREVRPRTDHGLIRYLCCIRATVPLLVRWRRKRVVVQNPSLVLALLAIVMKPVLRYQLIMDAHNAGLWPMEGRFRFLNLIASLLLRASDYVIVSNRELADYVIAKRGRPLVIPDPLPMHLCQDLPATPAIPGSVESAQATVVFVCTWASDEPYEEVIQAAAYVPNASFYITGNSRGKEQGIKCAISPNVCLVGYLVDSEYRDLVARADLIIDLTTRQSCLLCGAYEAVALEKPFVLTNTAALREYFSKGGVHVENNADSIAAGVKRVLGDLPRYLAEVKQLKREMHDGWRQEFDRTMELLAR